jgi:hypothetical protein
LAVEVSRETFALWESSVADLLFVVLTVALFAALTVLVKAAERG